MKTKIFELLSTTVQTLALSLILADDEYDGK